jgi:hypothetical protein
MQPSGRASVQERASLSPAGAVFFGKEMRCSADKTEKENRRASAFP